MLGWAIKRGLENATGAPAHDAANTTAADDTQIEQPDTPAPVFAVRALKTALFGTPAPKEQNRPQSVGDVPAAALAKTAKAEEKGPISPTKPAGILLTPGTATARRKRVSFNQDVRGNGQSAGNKGGSQSLSANPRPRTRLSDALEKSRKPERRSAPTESRPSEVDAFAAADDAWEEVDELDRDPDMTIDLNEPHSRSGRYWKSEFQQYHADAKVEMEKLVKYKQLAKSYAKMKDAEALELNQKLQEERDRVVEMEARVTELAAKIATQRMKGSDKDNQDLIKDLTQQTALAVQYRNQVKELDALLKTRQAESVEGIKSRRQSTSPRTHKTLLDTQRELKKAREQLRELGDLRKEIRHLKSDLRTAQQRELKVETENKHITQDLSKAKARIESLETRLKASEEAGGRHQQEAEDWKRKYEVLKENAKARYGEAEQAIRRKDSEISELKKEADSSKRADAASAQRRPRSLGSDETMDEWAARLDALTGGRTPNEEALKEAEGSSQRHDLPGSRRLAGDSRKRMESYDFQIREDKDVAHMNVPEESIELPILRERRTQQQPSATVSSERRAGRKGSALASGVSSLESLSAHDGARDRLPSLSERPTRGYGRKEGSHPDRLRSVLPVHNIREQSQKQQSMSVTARGDHASRRPVSSDSDEPGFDLVHGKFARLGGPETSTNAVWSMNASRSALPADRRAAAIARIEQKRSERRRLHERQGRNKENVVV
ncbi:uncharacterized protein E0L32_001891 [Thyridium curvatum]|uniref:Spindle pole body-associated protein cut12 domain-containing protein n=1 Tax=Thyridium curvatum TaxID=1093900 RepID=A0A507ANT2_9PEZI|nr:uncharacterized protein E0L32_001788 [Thyridium curvatum]XP_030990027.1 uncharacterized protein E0L32_001891 [Thyridium curvatum]TPX08213.1 hypothetical protein E0L32_001788 [Thyridium curvatum]TPX08316.1 hypothetical protein E0L32_001891 [Thyridium curvatum]